MMSSAAVDRETHELVAELVRVRRRLGWVQRDVAERMGVCASAVGHIEAGKRQPRLSAILRYAEAVGVALTVGAK